MDRRVPFRRYFGIRPNNPLLVQAVFCVHRVWESFDFLTTHTVAAILFARILQLDASNELPRIWDSLIKVYTLQRFWGYFGTK